MSGFYWPRKQIIPCSRPAPLVWRKMSCQHPSASIHCPKTLNTSCDVCDVHLQKNAGMFVAQFMIHLAFTQDFRGLGLYIPHICMWTISCFDHFKAMTSPKFCSFLSQFVTVCFKEGRNQTMCLLLCFVYNKYLH